MKKVIIHNVHGTGARESEWPQQRSSFSRSLLSKIEESNVEIQSFKWSGKNKFQSRIEAADNLCNKIRKCPLAFHVIIGHSHGGNVAMYASNRIQDDIQCLVITLSTPFVYLKNRKHFKRLNFANYKSLIFLSWYLWIICVLSYLFSSHFMLILFVSIIIYALTAINHLLFSFSKIRAKLLLSRLPIRNKNNSIIVYESPSDEAAFLLNVSSLLQKLALNICDKFTNKMAKYHIIVRSIHRKHYRKYQRGEKREPYNIFANPLNSWRILLLFLLVEFITLDNKIDTFDVFIFMSPFFIEFARIFIGVFFSLIASIFMMVAVSVIGRDETLSAPTLEFAVSSSPTGKSELRSFPYSGFDSLSHSSLYSQSSVINSIANDINDWVKGVR